MSNMYREPFMVSVGSDNNLKIYSKESFKNNNVDNYNNLMK